jgi:Spy/CpxP family protein refolding chaperone
MSVATPLTPNTQRPARSRWMVALLIASLAANFLIVGALASAAWRFRAPAVANLQFGPANIMSYLSELPSDRRATLWNDTTEPRRQLGPFRRAVRAARREVAASIRAEPFDQGRYLDAQAKLIEAERLQRMQSAKLFADVAGKLTPEERKTFVRWRDQRLSPGQRSEEVDLDRDTPPPAK